MAEDPVPTDTNQVSSDAQVVAQSSSLWHSIIAFLIIIVVIGGVGFYLFKKNGGQPAPTQPSADSIRQLFGYAAPTPQPTPMISATSTNIPAPTPTPTPVHYKSSVPRIQQYNNFRGQPEYTYAPLPYVRSGTLAPQTSSQPFVYRSTILGFVLQLPANWQVQSTGNSAAFVNSRGQNFEIESLIAYSGSLSDVQTLLQDSSSVVSVSNTTFQGSAALNYTTKDGQSNLAVIYEGKLYYILGAGGSTNILSTFSFIS